MDFMRYVEVVSIILLTLLVFSLIPFMCAIVAQRRNRNTVCWFLLGFLGAFTVVALLVLFAIQMIAAQ